MEANGNTPSHVPPIDLEVRVTTPWGRGGRSLEFVLNSPSGAVDFYQEPISGHLIHDPEKFRQRLFKQLEDLHRGLDVDGEPILHQEVFHELTTIGHDLYQALFPRAMRNVYGSIRNQVRTLLIISDEPWIPWEILRPSDFEDDDFFCLKFQMSRWLAGETLLAAEKRISRLLCLAAGEEAGLACAGLELQFLRELMKKTPGVDGMFRSHVPAQDLVALLEEERFDLLHLTGHGEHDEDRPGEAKIVLAGRALRARHLSPAAEKKLRRERPVVFFNSCQLGRLERSLTDLDGWAPRWVKRCGCSAFLAPFWSVNDARALHFAQVFYSELREGRTLGEAVLVARHKLRDEEPHETTWLAYSLYGHPGARILFGDHQPAVTANASAFRQAPPLPPLEPLCPVKQTRLRVGHPAAAHPSHRRLLGLVAAVSLAILAALALPLADKWRESQKVVHTTPNVPPDYGRNTDDGERNKNMLQSGSLEPSHEPPPPAPAVDIDRPMAKPEQAVPLLPVVPGTIGIIALDRTTRQPDADVAHAIDTTLARSGLIPVVVKADVPFVESLMRGDYSSLPWDGSSPWGVEYVLAATVGHEPLSQSDPLFKTVRLTMRAQLIPVSSRSTPKRIDATQAGKGATSEAAFEQAVERCLEDITEALKASQ